MLLFSQIFQRTRKIIFIINIYPWAPWWRWMASKAFSSLFLVKLSLLQSFLFSAAPKNCHVSPKCLTQIFLFWKLCVLTRLVVMCPAGWLVHFCASTKIYLFTWQSFSLFFFLSRGAWGRDLEGEGHFLEWTDIFLNILLLLKDRGAQFGTSILCVSCVRLGRSLWGDTWERFHC